MSAGNHLPEWLRLRQEWERVVAQPSRERVFLLELIEQLGEGWIAAPCRYPSRDLDPAGATLWECLDPNIPEQWRRPACLRCVMVDAYRSGPKGETE